MDGLSGAANVIAVVDISAKIASLCFQYSVAVKKAKEDIGRLQRKVNDIKDVLGEVQQLLDGRDKTRLSATNQLLDSLKECFLQLEELKTRLEPGKTRKAMSRFGVRALTWPFTSKEVEKHSRASIRLSPRGVPIRRNGSFPSPCCQIGDIFEPACRLADWSTSRYLCPLIVRISNLGVFLESSRAISLAIRVR
jgi:hypothetical protein